MVKLRERIVGMRQVASRISAACLLCALLVLGLLWPVPVSFAAEKDAAASEAAAELRFRRCRLATSQRHG